MLEINNLHAVVEEDGSEILKGVNLTIEKGSIHAIMGPNGSGKSTLSKVVAGHPAYEITEGEVLYEGEDITDLDPDERAQLGIFLAFQYPVEIPGVTNDTLLRQSYNAVAESLGREELDPIQFEDYIDEKLKLVDLDQSLLKRSVNAGFSGGEKKRNEIFQMAVLDPKLSFLDETDSGLDIDALKTVAAGINKISNEDNAIVLVTHYQRMLDYITPDYVHVMVDGIIAKTGDKELAYKLEDQGYDWLKPQTAVNGEVK